MNTLLQMQVFFFISSAGFIVLFILVATFLFYLISAMSAFSRIMDKIDEDISHLGDITKEMLNEVKDSFIFNLLFRKKKKHREK